MNLCPVSIPLLFLCFLVAHGENPTPFTGKVSINCGTSGTSAAVNGGEWLGDVKPKFSSLLQIKGSSSTASTVIDKLVSADPILHGTARISRSKFSYEFQVSPGQKIIRLHFYPTSYRGFKRFKDLFTVESGSFTLLSNFSASLAANALGVNTFVREFCLNVQENGAFNISFAPSSFDAYAFINGIEIISVPASLSYFHGGNVEVVDQKSSIYFDYNTVLEVIHRLSVKQSSIPSARDFHGIFPMWATQKLDKEKISTWKIPVDMGFRYLIRLYFSGIGLKLLEIDDVIFKVLINEMIVRTNIDIVRDRNGDNVPWYRDYVVTIRGNKNEGKKDILISLESYDKLIDGHELLAGFEILKLSNLDNSLASPNPVPPPQDSLSLFSVLDHRNAITTIAITVIALLSILVHKLREIWESSNTEEENKPSARAKRIYRRFSFVEIQLATNNFSNSLLIGKGGFGRVYKGVVDKGQNIVAVKRLKPGSNQGSKEFLTEIETLSELRHVNVVSLIGYCNEHGEMILVYDYLACGTLGDRLYKLQSESNICCSLTWKQRLDICIGASRGLDYLHTGHGIIHRDVKASNILLDEKFVAKISDFGLAKLPDDRSKMKSYVSTNVKGTFGYLDPYYFNTRKLTTKSDTYGFGVVLLEVLCGRPAIDSRAVENERALSKWALDNIRKGEVDQIVASCLRGKISPDSLKTFVGLAERCLCNEPKNRPTMSQVVLQLEFALEQQENKQNSALSETLVIHDDIHTRNDEIDLSITKEKLTIASQEEQNLASPAKEQNKDKQNLSITKKKLTIASQEEQNLSPPTKEQTKDRQNLVPSEISVVHDDSRPLHDESDLSITKKKLTMAPEDEQDLTPPTKEQTKGKVVNTELPTKRNNGRGATVHKTRRLWNGFWNRAKPSRKNEFSLHEIQEHLDEAGINLATFDWYTIAASTNQFSSSNKIGIGRFGPVYKAVLPRGQLVAVKRLSPYCSREFKNEIVLLENLRHRNIIKLLGYCMHEEEKILIYEFMKYGRLNDALLDGAYHQGLWIQWSIRFKVIIGIARGVGYLHQDSGLQLINRALSSYNILLDTEMNPKISNFSFARKLGEYQSEMETARVCGTYGYRAPEYCMLGQFSFKSDVYSFGIIVMQIVCGRKIQRYDLRPMSLPKYAWKLWNEKRASDLVDESLGGEYPMEEALRCIKIGLLCIQEQPHLRPAMPSVIKMLEGDEQIRQEPQEPWPLLQREDSAISSVRAA